MKKDIITIQLEDGSQKDMELVLVYTDDKNHKNYILYKEINENDKCYAAKYTMNNNNYQLDSNLTKEEILKLQLLLNSILEGNH